jgi:hypothetical protein
MQATRVIYSIRIKWIKLYILWYFRVKHGLFPDLALTWCSNYRIMGIKVLFARTCQSSRWYQRVAQTKPPLLTKSETIEFMQMSFSLLSTMDIVPMISCIDVKWIYQTVAKCSFHTIGNVAPPKKPCIAIYVETTRASCIFRVLLIRLARVYIIGCFFKLSRWLKWLALLQGCPWNNFAELQVLLRYVCIYALIYSWNKYML